MGTNVYPLYNATQALLIIHPNILNFIKYVDLFLQSLSDLENSLDNNFIDAFNYVLKIKIILRYA